jgi:hypothetical protein
MAYEAEVLYVNKNDEAITHIGGKNNDGTRWLLAEADAIKGIKEGRWKFFVIKDNKKVSVIAATSSTGKEYLRTEPDGYGPNNLLNLGERLL